MDEKEMTKILDDFEDKDTRTPEEIKAVLEAAERFEASRPGDTEAVLESVGPSLVPEDVIEETITRSPSEMIELIRATERFKVVLTERSFSGRNPELGPMIKCAQCGQRHRDNVKHDPIAYKEGTTQVEQGRPVANAAGWRAKPGKLMWIKELKKFMTLTR